MRASRVLIPGASTRIVLRCDEIGDPLNTSALVAWYRDERSGFAFVRKFGRGDDPSGFYKRLVAVRPRLTATLERTPERIGLEASIYFLPTPRAIVDLQPDEMTLIAFAANGMAVEALLSRGQLGEERSLRALFGLFEKGVFTLALGKASDPWKWRALVSEARSAPTPAPVCAVELPPRAPVENVALRSSHAALLRGVAPSQRPPEAHARFEQARAAVEQGHIHEALALLRQALVLAPRDPEISKTLGQLAFQNR